jgi:hypothetical protein
MRYDTEVPPLAERNVGGNCLALAECGQASNSLMLLERMVASNTLTPVFPINNVTPGQIRALNRCNLGRAEYWMECPTSESGDI